MYYPRCRGEVGKTWFLGACLIAIMLADGVVFMPDTLYR